MSRSLLQDWEPSIENLSVEMNKIAEDIYNTAYARGENHSDATEILDKIRAEITDCLKALDEIEKSGINIYLPNEISGRRLTYKQCLEFIDKYNAENEEKR